MRGSRLRIPNVSAYLVLFAVLLGGPMAAGARADTITITASADGTLESTLGNGTFNKQFTTSELFNFGLVIRQFSGIVADRSVMAFDLSALKPGTKMNSLTFHFDELAFTTNPERRVNVLGYGSNSPIALTDATQAATLLGTYDSAGLGLGIHDISLDASVLQSLVGTSTNLKLRLEGFGESLNTSNASLESPGPFFKPPQVIIDFTAGNPVPEPSTLCLAGVLGASLAAYGWGRCGRLSRGLPATFNERS
jgi:hypothetical protein